MITTTTTACIEDFRADGMKTRPNCKEATSRISGIVPFSEADDTPVATFREYQCPGLLQSTPRDITEREETPGFRDWNLPDLLVMERGLEHAVYELEPWRLYRVYAGFHLTREMYCYRSEDEGTESEWSGDSTAEDQEDPKNDQSNRSSEEGSEPGSGDLASDDSDEED
jgi:hypothetical protein